MMRMFDMDMEQQDDGTIRLTQQCGIDDPSVIDLHPAQVRLIAEQCGIFPASAWPPKGFLRDFERVRNVAGGLYGFLRSVPKFPPSEKDELDDDEAIALDLVERLDALHEDYLDGLAGVKPDAEPKLIAGNGDK